MSKLLSPVFSRRQAIKIIGAGGLALYLKPTFAFGQASGASTIASISPIDRSLPNVAERKFYGDDPERAHKILWDKRSFVKGASSAKKESASIVVVGGGLSGLTSAYLLREHKPVVLEYATRFGGNAKGQSWNGVDYSIGAAYFIEPEEDSDIANLIKELGVDKILKIKEEEDPCELDGKRYNNFWAGDTSPDGKDQFIKLSEYFKKVNEGEEIAYPDIPITDPEQTSYIKELDSVSFKAHLEKIAGGPLHPHITTAIEHYCWSSFGAAMSEISAASGLNFYSSEFSNIAVLPGGNSAFTEALVSKLNSDLPAGSLRPGSLVADIKTFKDHVEVLYSDISGAAHVIHAKAVVMACPKFIAAKIIDDLEPQRRAAIAKLRYRSYLVANVLIKGPLPDPFYDYYLLGDGKTSADIQEASRKQKATDVIYANYASTSTGDTVLTIYRGFPVDGARAELYDPGAYPRYRDVFERQINDSILPLIKLKKEDIVDVRIARWGHPLPVAATGLIANGTIEEIRKPFKDRVFFVEQDNWALPAFETAVTEAYTWAPAIGKMV